jgi:hypothetical protein
MLPSLRTNSLVRSGSAQGQNCRGEDREDFANLTLSAIFYIQHLMRSAIFDSAIRMVV